MSDEKVARVLSLGAGVQSSALLLMYFHQKIEPKVDFAVFSDTGAEPPGVYEWLNKLERYMEGSPHQIPVVKCTRGNIAEDLLSKEKKRFAAVPFFIRNPDGSKGMGRRQCTREYKIDVIRKAIRERLGYKPRQRVKHHVYVSLGISYDEIQRMKDAREKWQTNLFPLIERELRRKDCVEYVESLGLGTPPRSACYICPYRSNGEWEDMKNNDPETFEKAVDFDRRIRRNNPKMRGESFVHPSLKPLEDVVFRSPQMELGMGMENECDGMCGV